MHMTWKRNFQLDKDSARDLSTQRIYTTVPDLSPLSFSNMAVARGGQISLSPCRFAILGGGISGLAAAYHLLDKVTDPSNITVLESSGRAGGWMQSWTGENGTVFELGPRSIRPVGKAGRATLKMVRSTFYGKIIWDNLFKVFNSFNSSVRSRGTGASPGLDVTG